VPVVLVVDEPTALVQIGKDRLVCVEHEFSDEPRIIHLVRGEATRVINGVEYVEAVAPADVEIVRAVALQVDGVMSSPEPQVIIRNFAESAIDLQLRVWIGDARQRRTIGDLITDRVKQEFDRAGVEIPYAKRDLYIRAMPTPPAGAAGSSGSSEQAAALVDSPPDNNDEKAAQTKGGEADE